MDTIQVSRMALAVRRSGERFLRRIFTPVELTRSNDINFLSTRFAAKEAFFKALGTGLAGGARWHDLELPPGEGKALVPVVTGRSLDLLADRRVLVSVSSSGTTAVAVVVITTVTEDGVGE